MLCCIMAVPRATTHLVPSAPDYVQLLMNTFRPIKNLFNLADMLEVIFISTPAIIYVIAPDSARRTFPGWMETVRN